MYLPTVKELRVGTNGRGIASKFPGGLGEMSLVSSVQPVAGERQRQDIGNSATSGGRGDFAAKIP